MVQQTPAPQEARGSAPSTSSLPSNLLDSDDDLAGRGLPPERRVRVVVVGGGFAGLGMALRLEQSGITDFVVLERASDVGGTWRDNHYPGCACDVPSHLYSYSFKRWHGWSRVFAPQREIHEYIRRFAEEHDLYRHVEYDADLVSAVFDETEQVWRCRTRDGRRYVCQWLVSATGGLSNPLIPNLPGTERFRGVMFHSATWKHDYDLRGKRVAVIGTGASAIQFVPEIQPQVAELHVFQRTAPWVLPKPDRAFTRWELAAFRLFPVLTWLYRTWLFWTWELRLVAFLKPDRWMRIAEKWGRDHIERSIEDPELRKAVTPDYTPGCKRILLSNNYYPSLDQPNVEVITSGVAEIREHSVVTRDGREIEVDAIIYGTGFDVHDTAGRHDYAGRGGVRLHDAWADGMRAYLGAMVHGFPNLLFIAGPTTGVGHTSFLTAIEASVEHAARCIELAERERLASLEVRADVEKAYMDSVQEKFDGTVWKSGCASWYQDKQGNVTAIYPDYTYRLKKRLSQVSLANYVTVPSKERVTTAESEPALAV